VTKLSMKRHLHRSATSSRSKMIFLMSCMREHDIRVRATVRGEQLPLTQSAQRPSIGERCRAPAIGGCELDGIPVELRASSLSVAAGAPPSCATRRSENARLSGLPVLPRLRLSGKLAAVVPPPCSKDTPLRRFSAGVLAVCCAALRSAEPCSSSAPVQSRVSGAERRPHCVRNRPTPRSGSRKAASAEV
jgi:hypothetical protein